MENRNRGDHGVNGFKNGSLSRALAVSCLILCCAAQVCLTGCMMQTEPDPVTAAVSTSVTEPPEPDTPPEPGRELKADTAAEIFGASDYRSGDSVEVKGFYTAGDGGAGIWRIYRSVPAEYRSGTEPAVGGAVRMTGNGLYACLDTNEGRVSAAQVGLKGDGTADNTETLDSVIACEAVKSLYFPKGVYLVCGVTLKSDFEMYGETGSVLMTAPDSYDESRDAMFFTADAQNVRIHHLVFDGNEKAYPKGYSPNGTTAFGENAGIAFFEIRNADYLYIHDCEFNCNDHTAIRSTNGFSEHITLSKNRFADVGCAVGLEGYHFSEIVIDGNTFDGKKSGSCVSVKIIGVEYAVSPVYESMLASDWYRNRRGNDSFVLTNNTCQNRQDGWMLLLCGAADNADLGVKGALNGVTIEKNTVDGALGGFSLERVNGGTVGKNTVKTTGTGLMLTACQDVAASGNQFDGNDGKTEPVVMTGCTNCTADDGSGKK